MKILIACEISGRVRDAFIKEGHNAFSCDIQHNSHPKHITGNVLDIINDNWDLMVAHPPCTYLSWAGAGALTFNRMQRQEEAIEFFKKLYFAPIFHICIENPLGYMNKYFMRESQIIHPYYFGDPQIKRTCLWLKNLPLLVPTNRLKKPAPVGYYKNGPKKGRSYNWADAQGGRNRAEIRSITFTGIANAMAKQWSIVNEMKFHNPITGSLITGNYANV